METKTAFIVHQNDFLTYFGPLMAKAMANKNQVLLFANKSQPHSKPHLNPFLHPEHLQQVPYSRIIWYETPEALAGLLQKEGGRLAVFTVEALPMDANPAPFKFRRYKIYNLPHSADNIHTKAIAEGVLDKSIAPFEKYGEYLGWNKTDFVVLGSPKYDSINSLSAEAIRKKYALSSPCIVIFAPNTKLLPFSIFLKIFLRIKMAGYKVVIKGKYPGRHHPLYRFLGKYFLSQKSFYPSVVHELLTASQGAVAFDSTVVEEALMLRKPLVNFSIKPYRTERKNFKQFIAMWQSDFCLDINLQTNTPGRYLTKLPPFTHHFKKTVDYQKMQKETFFVPGGVSQKILEFVEND